MRQENINETRPHQTFFIEELDNILIPNKHQ